METTKLTAKKCVPCEGGIPALTQSEVNELLKSVHNWEAINNYSEITRHFHFKNFHKTMEFVNAVANMAHEENHHPDLEVGYNYCRIRYSTHAIGGLSENDFICAAKVDHLAL